MAQHSWKLLCHTLTKSMPLPTHRSHIHHNPPHIHHHTTTMEAAAESFHRTTDLAKIERHVQHALELGSDSRGGPLIVLLLSGSFNPIHLMHVEMLEIAKDHLQSRGDRVVGGLIAPSSDNYVGKKLKREAIGLRFRCEFAAAAVADSDWQSVCGMGFASSRYSAEIAEYALNRHFQSQLHPGATASTSASTPPALIVVREVCGADHVARYNAWHHPFVCVGRQGHNAEIKRAIARGFSDVHEDFCLIDDDERLRDFSSSSIRTALRGLETGDLSNLTARQLPIHPEVARKMQMHGRRMLLTGNPKSKGASYSC
jgi:nicotinic acid mononucleotide adenylyltransferase